MSLIDAESHEVLAPFAYQETCNLLYGDDKALFLTASTANLDSPLLTMRQ
ncbi:hypothetical protein WIW49_02980 [Xanthomonas euroxanthea]